MCEVCAVFGISEHWVDSARIDEHLLAASNIQGHRSERTQRLALLNALAAPHDIRINDWDGEAYCVEDIQGRTRIASDLSTLWRTIEQMSAAVFDPLARDFLPGDVQW